MEYKIALIRGDGIGPEIVEQAVGVMNAVGKKFGHTISYTEVDLGGCATDKYGVSYPEGTAEKCRACDAVLLGAMTEMGLYQAFAARCACITGQGLLFRQNQNYRSGGVLPCHP